jgi:hypothetical protein
MLRAGRVFPSLAAVLALLEMLQLPAGPEPGPGVRVGMRAAAGPDSGLRGPATRVYRAQPEVMLCARQSDRVDLFAAGSAGPALVVRGPSNGAVDVSLSGALGVRVRLPEATVVTMLRAETVASGGPTVTLALQLSFDGGSRREARGRR